MRKLLGDNWRRLGLQLALLTGIGLAFAVGSRGQSASAGGMDECPAEGECSIKKPNVMLIVDYSTSMNLEWDQINQLSRWEVAVAAITNITAPGSYLSQTTHLALLRFGHDPDPIAPGTVISNEASGLVDGVALDVAWDDDNGEYLECNGQVIGEALAATPAPMMGSPFGIGTWTKGALDATASEIAATKSDHAQDELEPARAYVNVVVTDSAWTGVDGSQPLIPANQDPAISAAAMFDQQGIRTYVIALADDPQAEVAADQLAAAGGTAEALHASSPAQLDEAFNAVVDAVNDSLEGPQCADGPPRVMILLDGSSAMLNLGEGPNATPASPGTGRWDQARDALAGEPSLFGYDTPFGEVEDVAQLGLASFGEPDEAKILVQYAACAHDNFWFALDPQTSCEQPGCEDPWAGPPITWTFKDGTEDPPGFDTPTQSHMPQCAGQDGEACQGSGRSLHTGLQLLAANHASYHEAAQDPMAPYPTTPQTQYLNVVILGGRYDGHSTDAQIQAPLQAMANDGITTRVIGFGVDENDPVMLAQLQAIADWGSAGTKPHLVGSSQFELEVALATVFDQIPFDPCCAFNDCGGIPKFTTSEPDPVPQEESSEGDGDGDGDGDPGGDGDGDPGGDGDGDPGGDGDGDSDSGEADTLAGEGESGDGGYGETGTGDDASVLSGRGCACAASPGGEGRLGGFWGLLGLLACRRWRRR
ncbi:Alpha-amylase [Enhygromyxa salina]|uniref:Alpha-amylase n=1 Tax=Enhygromyxa salina TaxID=215803 RepID=A0A0C2D3M5_9BACT|nr:hypothetical protein [Enhygromyxa salina]KIG16330.1 Alpha-amylase [Enhygromyxa salina]